MVRAVENLRKRKLTGGRRKPARQKRLYEKDSYSTECILGESQKRARRRRGGTMMVVLDAVNVANVVDPSTGKTKRTAINSVVANPSNRDYERRGVITMGAIISTELGKARVVSRPGQHGLVNAILVK